MASVTIIFVVCYTKGKENITDWRMIFIGVLSLAVIFSFKKVNSAGVVIGAAGVGYLLTIMF